VVVEALYGGCDPAAIEWALTNFRPAPYRPKVEPVIYDAETLRGLRKYYMECDRDRAIPLSLQQQMQQGIEFAGVVCLHSDHSPMSSHPEELAEALLHLAQ